MALSDFRKFKLWRITILCNNTYGTTPNNGHDTLRKRDHAQDLEEGKSVDLELRSRDFSSCKEWYSWIEMCIVCGLPLACLDVYGGGVLNKSW